MTIVPAKCNHCGQIMMPTDYVIRKEEQVKELERELKRIKELLREPSEEMCIKGDETGMFMCGDECCHDHSDCAETVWESMSAALLAQVSKEMNDE